MQYWDGLCGEFHGRTLVEFGIGDDGHSVGVLLRVIPSEHDVFHGVLVESVRCLAEPGQKILR